MHFFQEVSADRIFNGIPSVFSHSRLIKDDVRVSRFKEAIFSTVKSGDIVLDLGSGTGLLSYFAVKAGATRVYAVEMSKIGEFGKEFLKNTNEGESVFHINGCSSSIDIPEPCDVLVTEIIGNIVIEEGIIEAILDAKRRHLKSTATVIPKSVELRLTPAFDPLIESEVLTLSNELYGLDKRSLVDKLSHRAYMEVDAHEKSYFSSVEKVCKFDFSQRSLISQNYKALFHVTKAGVINCLSASFFAELANSIGIDSLDTSSWSEVLLPLKKNIRVDIGQNIEIDTRVLFENKSFKIEVTGKLTNDNSLILDTYWHID